MELRHRKRQTAIERQDVLELFRFIDWLLVLPEPLEQAFRVELSQLEEEQKVPHLSSIERIGLQKGLEQGRQEGRQEGFLEEGQAMVLEAVSMRFGVVPEDVVQAVHAITARETLRALHRQAFSVPDLAAFREALRLGQGVRLRTHDSTLKLRLI